MGHNDVTFRKQLVDRLALEKAVTQEVSSSSRLLPSRWDMLCLKGREKTITRWAEAQYKMDEWGSRASIVLADKSSRGTRPLSELTLLDRVLLSALVDLMRSLLPSNVTERMSYEDFRQAPLSNSNAQYIAKTDVTSYYEFVDHELLGTELVSQTGEWAAVEALLELLNRVMGRRVGLPQVHKASDLLGDVYIDPVRRELRRAGHDVHTFSDDFLFATLTLADARGALEQSSLGMRRLGLAPNEGKTLTYSRTKYQSSLDEFSKIEESLSDDAETHLEWLSTYGDESGNPLDAEPPKADDSWRTQVRAAERALELWLSDYRHEGESLPPRRAAVSQSLLRRALPVLGLEGSEQPLEFISTILRREPALAPDVGLYMQTYSVWNDDGDKARSTLDELVAEKSFGVWQKMWIAESGHRLEKDDTERPYYTWLEECLREGPSPLAATAAATLAAIEVADPKGIAEALPRLDPAWRGLGFWALATADAGLAEEVANDRIESLILEATHDSANP